MGGLVKTAILVDGDFFIKRMSALKGRRLTALQMTRELYWGTLKHLKLQKRPKALYRIFFYDCPPFTKTLQNPLDGRGFSYHKLPSSVFRLELHDLLKRQRKVALRLGRMSDHGQWVMGQRVIKQLVKGEKDITTLTPRDVSYDTRQKGVDMKIGLDIASLSYKRMVDQIILIAGDSDFVPAAKLARREGIDFILDPMWNHINPDLHEHIDGLQTPWDRPTKK